MVEFVGQVPIKISSAKLFRRALSRRSSAALGNAETGKVRVNRQFVWSRRAGRGVYFLFFLFSIHYNLIKAHLEAASQRTWFVALLAKSSGTIGARGLPSQGSRPSHGRLKRPCAVSFHHPKETLKHDAASVFARR